MIVDRYFNYLTNDNLCQDNNFKNWVFIFLSKIFYLFYYNFCILKFFIYVLKIQVNNIKFVSFDKELLLI